VDRAEKTELVATLNRTFSETSVVVVTHYIGLTVGEMGDLRARIREAGAGFKVTRNRLTKLALEGTAFGGLADMFVGPTAIAYSNDPVAAPKVVIDFAKTNPKLVVIGGAFGADVLSPDGVKSLASLPSLDELRGRLVGLLQAPAGKVAAVLQAPAGQVARVLAARAEQPDQAA